MRLLIASILAFICICGLQYILACCGLGIHNHLLNMAVCATAGAGSVLLAQRVA